MSNDHKARTQDGSVDVDDDLLALRATAAPRRSDDAFARAVTGDVRARRGRWSMAWLAAPALAGAAVVVVALQGGPGPMAQISTQTLQALAQDELIIDVDVDVDGLDDATLLALLDEPRPTDSPNDADAPERPFAISGLDGSTDRELLDVEAALDRALRL